MHAWTVWIDLAKARRLEEKKIVKLSRVERMKATVPSALVDGKPAEGSFNLQDLLGSASRTSSLTN